jgi:REP-associated tyrosine transposase
MSRRPHRLPTFSYVGLHRYSLTFCTHRRVHAFVDKAIVTTMVTQILQAARDRRFAVIAYCFMPDHVHLLVEGEAEDSDLPKFARAVKQRTGLAYRNARNRPLWQKGYFEHVLRDAELTLVVAKYILGNPVRGGLCVEPRDYPFSGSLVWSKEELQDLWR